MCTQRTSNFIAKIENSKKIVIIFNSMNKELKSALGTIGLGFLLIVLIILAYLLFLIAGGYIYFTYFD